MTLKRFRVTGRPNAQACLKVIQILAVGCCEVLVTEVMVGYQQLDVSVVTVEPIENLGMHICNTKGKLV